MMQEKNQKLKKKETDIQITKFHLEKWNFPS